MFRKIIKMVAALTPVCQIFPAGLIANCNAKSSIFKILDASFMNLKGTDLEIIITGNFLNCNSLFFKGEFGIK